MSSTTTSSSSTTTTVTSTTTTLSSTTTSISSSTTTSQTFTTTTISTTTTVSTTTYARQLCNGVVEAAGCGSRIPKEDCQRFGEHGDFARHHCPQLCDIPCTSTATISTTTASTTTVSTTTTTSTTTTNTNMAASSSKIRTLYIVLGLLAVVVLIFITLMLARKHSASNISSTPSASETYGTEMVNFGSGKAQSTPDTVELANSMVPSFQMHGTASRAVLTAAPLRDRPSGLRVETASDSFEPSSKSRASPPHTPSFGAATQSLHVS